MSNPNPHSADFNPNDPYSDPADFWRHRGDQRDESTYGISADHKRQELALDLLLKYLYGLLPYRQPPPNSVFSAALEQPRPRPSSIFEAGCGRGRLAKFFADHPLTTHATYTAIDVGLTQLEETANLRPDAELYQADLLQFDPLTQPSHQSARADHRVRPNYDLVIASEVLMHIRPGNDIRIALRRLLNLASPAPETMTTDGLVILIEWVPPEGELEAYRARVANAKAAGQLDRPAIINPDLDPETGLAYWNFPHDYSDLLDEMDPRHNMLSITRTDRQCIFVLEP